MKKTLISLAVAAGMAASSAAVAAPTVYGQLHLDIRSLDSADNLDMSSNTSAIGVKGSEDLGNGVKGFYKAEFQLDVADDNVDKADATNPAKVKNAALTQRDVYVGIKGGMGTVKLGTLSSNYKQMGGKVDALYRTAAEGRGLIHTQSKLHKGSGEINTGRMSNQIQYSSPKMGGMQLVVNTTTSNNDDETMGVGFRYSAKSFSVYADMINVTPQLANTTAIPPVLQADNETATKFGAKYATGAYFVGAQLEQTEDVVGYDYMHLNGGYAIDKSNVVVVTYGTASHISDSKKDTTGLALAYDHKMSKNTDVYVAYVDKSSDTSAMENSGFALGMRVKF